MINYSVLLIVAICGYIFNLFGLTLTPIGVLIFSGILLFSAYKLLQNYLPYTILVCTNMLVSVWFLLDMLYKPGIMFNNLLVFAAIVVILAFCIGTIYLKSTTKKQLLIALSVFAAFTLLTMGLSLVKLIDVPDITYTSTKNNLIKTTLKGCIDRGAGGGGVEMFEVVTYNLVIWELSTEMPDPRGYC